MGMLSGLSLRSPALLHQPTPGAHLLASVPISAMGPALGSAVPLAGCWAQGQVIKVLLRKYQAHLEGVGVFRALPHEPGLDSQPLQLPGPGLGQAEHAGGSVTETSPEQRGSEVHTKKTVMIKTIETRDGEVSGLPWWGPWGTSGGCQPGAFHQLCLFEPLSGGRRGPAMLGWGRAAAAL